MSVPVITIDGPSGSGKGTITKEVASTLNWHILDSGALYRILALAVEGQQVDWGNEVDTRKIISELDIDFQRDASGCQVIYLDEIDVTKEIRQEKCGTNASRIAKFSLVRHELMLLQKNFIKSPGLVADGRDMGTVVFPEAVLKIFLTASAAERSKRRYKQLKEQGINVSLSAVLKDILNRDEQDESRDIAPLVPALDAVTIDSSNLSIDNVSQEIIRLYKARMNA
jgi:cytidylate kinase|tara:strand:+ start:1411 stop:2088 length:678 start_codon:yes stop_codon:yes gene_type:complete